MMKTIILLLVFCFQASAIEFYTGKYPTPVDPQFSKQVAEKAFPDIKKPDSLISKQARKIYEYFKSKNNSFFDNTNKDLMLAVAAARNIWISPRFTALNQKELELLQDTFDWGNGGVSGTIQEMNVDDRIYGLVPEKDFRNSTGENAQ